MYIVYSHNNTIDNRAEPNTLKILPIIPSQTSQKFDPLFLFYAHIDYHLLFLLILVIIIVSVIIMSTIHTVTIILVNRIIDSADFS